MDSRPTESFNALVEQYLGARLPSRLADPCDLSGLPVAVRQIIRRALALMKRASYPITDITSQMIWLFSTVTPAMLPAAWEGRIPPLTFRGRHEKLDRYVDRQMPSIDGNRPVFVDLGCGFPPLTTVDTARSLQRWSIYGVDRSFASFVLYDTNGDYACFDSHGGFMYFQPGQAPLHDTPATTRHRFETVFSELSAGIQAIDVGASRCIEKDGYRLVANHVRDFEASNLRFVEAEIEGLQLPLAQVARCMNVLLYFDANVRRRMRDAMAALLEGNGLMITGFNHPFGIYARYMVHAKEATGMSPREFAFSTDNLRPLGIGPWVTIQGEDEDADLLAELTGAIRNDRPFWGDFGPRVDALQEEYGICRRDADGFIRFTGEARTASPLAILEKTRALWRQLEAEGYTDGAVAALGRAGYRAWKNPVGDIAVMPPSSTRSEQCP